MQCSKIQKNVIAVVNASPILLLVLIFTWSYYAYNISLSYNLIRDGHYIQGLLYILFYHPILVLCLWSYWTVCKTSPGYTVEMYKKKDDEENVGLLEQSFAGDAVDEEEVGRDKHIAVLNVADNDGEQHSPQPITVKRDGARRFCNKCKIEKFDRTHHCRQCNRCVLKMDHHCPWINNCVGFGNYKSFYLFLVYASLYCIYVFATTLPVTIIQVNGPLSILGLNLHCAILVFISGIFGLFLIPFTIFHTRQLCKNRTTIEFYEKANYKLGGGNGYNRRVDIMRSKYFNPWDIGTRKNIEQVMGKDLWKMLVPTGRPFGDGSSFPINSYAYETLGADELSDEEEDF